jgi:hypothetical protein
LLSGNSRRVSAARPEQRRGPLVRSRLDTGHCPAVVGQRRLSTNQGRYSFG